MRKKMRQWTRVLWWSILWSAPGTALSAEIPPLVEQKCAACHGRNGQSESDAFPKLAQQNADYLVKQLFNFKTGQRVSTVMFDVANGLSSEQIRELAAYFSALPVAPSVVRDQRLVAAGRELYFNGNPKSGISACSSCHGKDARGGAQLPRLASQHASYIEVQLENFRKGTRGGTAGIMHGVVTKITGPEIKAVAQYLSGLN
jgi:cytochrome c553